MKNKLLNITFLLCFLTINVNLLFAQCDETESLIIVTIATDDHGYETYWNLVGTGGEIYAEVPPFTYASNTVYMDTLCVPSDECVVFTIGDNFGDGITGNGYYNVSQNGQLIYDNIGFTAEISFPMICAPGQYCNTAVPVTEGMYTTTEDDHWYIFVTDAVGIYEISTCFETNTCDTEIWVYDICNNINATEDNDGTIFYNDNDGGCDLRAVVQGAFDVGQTLYIRIGDADDDCATNEVDWEINYVGPVVGCTDPVSCNYSPLATVDDQSCIYFGEPGCPDGPDLSIRQDVIASSMYVSIENNNDACYIDEGCMNGYGDRSLIRFTTWIDNIGDTDYHIGPPDENSDQFTYDNCHSHYHYDGYAEYVVYNADLERLPIGFKNGFCVMDLICDEGISPKYGCGNMGITAGCGDYYLANLPCQFIDVTDLPDGDYTLVVRTNWDNAPDALGRYETDTSNNWAQVCINLNTSTGTLEVTQLADCPSFADCAGIPFGDTQPDCTGECGGISLMGDVDNNSVLDIHDASTYISLLAGDDIEATPCNDLSGDGLITVFDAALLGNCINFGAGHIHSGSDEHDHCEFQGIVNPNDTVSLSIIDWNEDENYIDVGIRNPTASVVAYQFQMSGIQVINTDNLIDPASYPIHPVFNYSTQTVYGISYQDSTIYRSNLTQSLVRLYYTEITGPEICIEAIHDIVNRNYEATHHLIEGNCLVTDIVGVNDLLKDLDISVFPNPLKSFTRFDFTNPSDEAFILRIIDSTGKLIQAYHNIKGDHFELDASNLGNGIYFYKLNSKSYQAVGKLMVSSP